MKNILIAVAFLGLTLLTANSFAGNFAFENITANLNLQTAVQANDVETAKQALKNGANPDTSFEYPSGSLPVVVFAASENSVLMVEILLSHGANINIQVSTGDTALMMAVAFNADETIKLLLDHGANTTITNNDGFTALDYAQHMKNEEAVMALEVKKVISEIIASL